MIQPVESDVTTIQIECPKGVRKLFSDLPLRFEASQSEKELLVPPESGTKKTNEHVEDRIYRIAWAVSAVVCTLFLIAVIVVVSVLFRRVDNTITTIDAAVSFHNSAKSMIRNVDTLLNTSAHLATTLHKIGLKGLDATMFSRPYLTHMLNTTTNVLNDVHSVVKNPSIRIGG
jgi:archaellum component FlaF (FlaF/FlaG flagellin family)